MKRKSIYDNYKAQRPLDRFFGTEGEMDYKWRGKDYTINKDNFTSLDPALQQSFTHYCANQYQAPKPKPRPMSVEIPNFQRSIGPNKVGTWKPVLRTSTETQRIEVIRRELLRIATTVTIVEEKLDYPRVFKALLSQPHTALDQLKKHEDYKINLTLFVDENVHYHETNKWFHNSIMNAASGIKGIHLYTSNAMRGHFKGDKRKQEYRYYTDLLATLPKEQQKKILVFTQGCGEVENNWYEKAVKLKPNITFCTWFHKGENCGCNQIRQAEIEGLSVKYAIREPKDLATLFK